MIVRLYAVLDHKIDDFHLSIMDIKDEGAIRQFSDAVNDPQTKWNKHPEDYSLWYVGRFDTEKGMVIEDRPKNLVNALAVKAMKVNNQMEMFGNNGEAKEAEIVK